MAQTLILPISTPPLPQNYAAPTASTSRISHPHTRTLLPAGPAYLTHLRLTTHHAHSFTSLDKHLEEEKARLDEQRGLGAIGEDDLGVGDEEETEELLGLDPKEWKVGFFFSDEGEIPDLSV